MINARFLILIGLLASFKWLHAQAEPSPGFITNDTVKVLSEQRYAGGALWGYMNGGADVYLEYGIHYLLVQEIEWDGIPLKAEIYHMKGVEQAYGIFSIHAGESFEENTQAFSSKNAWQYQAAVGEYYLSLVNSSGSATHARITATAGEWFVKRYEDEKLVVPELPPAGKEFGPVLHARGMLGMRNAMPEINPLFRELEGYALWMRVDHKTRNIVARVEAPVGLMNYIQIKARVMDTPLGDIYVTEFNRIDDNTALFRCQYRSRKQTQSDQ